MLADIIIGRSAFGGERGRDDLHRHATFSCAMSRLFRRIKRLVSI